MQTNLKGNKIRLILVTGRGGPDVNAFTHSGVAVDDLSAPTLPLRSVASVADLLATSQRHYAVPSSTNVEQLDIFVITET